MSSASNVWQHFTFKFTATGLVTTLEFRNMLPAAKQYSFLDNASVEVAAVPEPETYAMLLAGLAGFAVRRKMR